MVMRRGSLNEASPSLMNSRSSRRRHARALVQHHGGGDILAEPRMRHAERRGLRHLRMPHQGLVDLQRRDLLAAAVDQLLLASVQCEKAIRIEAADVAGANTSRRQRCRGCARGR
jgi:hypothetical protein